MATPVPSAMVRGSPIKRSRAGSLPIRKNSRKLICDASVQRMMARAIVASISTASALYSGSKSPITRGLNRTPVSMNAMGGVRMLREATPEMMP